MTISSELDRERGKLSSAATASPSTSRLIVVFGTKGGVGKTLVATNLAVSLAQQGAARVCLMDLDVMAVGDAAKMLKVDAPQVLAGLLPAGPVTDGRGAVEELVQRVLVPHASGVDVVPCLANPRQAAQLNPAWLPAVFEALRARYAYIVVDGGKAFSDALLAVCDAANVIVLVTSPDVLTLYQTQWALSMLESLAFPSAMVKAVLNRAESAGSVAEGDVRRAITCDIIGTIPSEGATVGAAVNQGLPVVTAFRQSRVAQAFDQLAAYLASSPQAYVSAEEVARHRRRSAPAGGGRAATLYAPQDHRHLAEPPDELIALKRRLHERLLQELDLKRLDPAAVASSAQLAHLRRKTEQIIDALLSKERHELVGSTTVRAKLVKELADEALGLGPLEELLEDPDVADVLVNSKDEIYIERRGKLELTAKKFMSTDQLYTVIERIVSTVGRRIDEANAMVDARLPDGSRVNAIIPPLAVGGPVLSIRKFARQRYGLEELARAGALTEPMARFLSACVAIRKNLVISGGAGSGKTTLLNALSAFIPERERIITIEDAAELNLVQRHWVRLEARLPNVEGRGGVGVRELFRNALRMRPDRVIIGECRGAETLDMLQAMNTGHEGSMTTVHANSTRDVLTRLTAMVLMSNVELPVDAVARMIASAIQLVVHTARLSDGSRKVVSISEVTGLDAHGHVEGQELFVYRQTGIAPDGAVKGSASSTGQAPRFLDEFATKGLAVEPAWFQAAAAGGRS